MNTISKYVFMSIVLIISCIFAVIFLTGCLSAPSRNDFKIESCFSFQACMYRNQKNTDKAICGQDKIDCAKDREIKRRKDMIKYCMDKSKIPKNMKYSECQTLFLGAK